MDKYIQEINSRVLSNITVTELKNKTVLITGANGLIGSAVADFLLYLNTEYSYNISIILTSLSKSPARIAHLLSESSITYIPKDLSLNIYESFDIDIDYCFYCAGYAQPSKFLSDPHKTFFLNTIGVNNVFNDVYKNKHAKCIFLSSSEVYALNETETSHNESDNINISLQHKRNPYIFGKIAGEMVVNNFIDQGYSGTSIRVSLCYGPGHLADDTRVMSDISRNAMNEEHIVTLFDEGEALRRYIHMSDFLVMLFNISLRGTQRVYNVGGEEEISIYNMALHIGRFFKKTIQKGVTKNKVSVSAPNRVWVSMERYTQEFSKINFLPFKDGIKSYLQWFNKFNEEKK